MGAPCFFSSIPPVVKRYFKTDTFYFGFLFYFIFFPFFDSGLTGNKPERFIFILVFIPII